MRPLSVTARCLITPTRRARAFCLLVGFAILLTGCESWPPFRNPGSASGYSEQELFEDLAGYAGRFAAVVAGAASKIHDTSSSRRIRRSTLIWRLRTIPVAQELAFGDDAQSSYVVSLGLAVGHRIYLTEGDGREIFGEHQPIAVQAAEDVEQSALAIGPLFLDEEQMARLVARIEVLARENPIRGYDFNIENAQQAASNVESGGLGLDWVTRIPMSPFRALEGVGTAGAAMLELNRTAIEFSKIVDELPRQNRWQIELLLYDLEDRDTVIAGLAAFEQMAASAERASAAIARLPDDLRAVLSQSEGAIAEANRTLEVAQQVMVPVSATVEEIGRISALLAELQSDADGAEPEPGRPFDVREYEATAREVGTSAQELNALLESLDQLLASERLQGAIVTTVDQTEHEISGLIGRIKIAGVQLIVLFFALLLLYRWASQRISAPRA